MQEKCTNHQQVRKITWVLRKAGFPLLWKQLFQSDSSFVISKGPHHINMWRMICSGGPAKTAISLRIWLFWLCNTVYNSLPRVWLVKFLIRDHWCAAIGNKSHSTQFFYKYEGRYRLFKRFYTYIFREMDAFGNISAILSKMFCDFPFVFL